MLMQAAVVLHLCVGMLVTDIFIGLYISPHERTQTNGFTAELVKKTSANVATK